MLTVRRAADESSSCQRSSRRPVDLVRAAEKTSSCPPQELPKRRPRKNNSKHATCKIIDAQKLCCGNVSG
ncbi:uncharacterized protein LOC144158271 isoform X4 [Haemaphysalis longicornis]